MNLLTLIFFWCMFFSPELSCDRILAEKNCPLLNTSGEKNCMVNVVWWVFSHCELGLTLSTVAGFKVRSVQYTSQNWELIPNPKILSPKTYQSLGGFNTKTHVFLAYQDTFSSGDVGSWFTPAIPKKKGPQSETPKWTNPPHSIFFFRGVFMCETIVVGMPHFCLKIGFRENERIGRSNWLNRIAVFPDVKITPSRWFYIQCIRFFLYIIHL